MSIKHAASFALKSTENTFKSHFESMVKWSKITHDYSANTEELMERKLVIVKLVELVHPS